MWYTHIYVYSILGTALLTFYTHTHTHTQELCQLTDRLQDAYKDEITMLKNKGRPLYTSDPRPATQVESDEAVHVDYNWIGMYIPFIYSSPSIERPPSNPT